MYTPHKRLLFVGEKNRDAYIEDIVIYGVKPNKLYKVAVLPYYQVIKDFDLIKKKAYLIIPDLRAGELQVYNPYKKSPITGFKSHVFGVHYIERRHVVVALAYNLQIF